MMQVDSEEPVFEAVLNWVKHKRKEREPFLPDMLEHVRMPLLTPRYITDVIDAEVSSSGPSLQWTFLQCKRMIKHYPTQDQNRYGLLVRLVLALLGKEN